MTGSHLDEEAVDRLLAATSVAELLEIMHEASIAIGGDKFSYHTEVMFEGIASVLSEVYSVGFSDEWRTYYIDQGARLIDPGPDITMRRGKPTTWHDALSSRRLTRAELDYVAETVRMGITSGYGFPLWGPNGHNAYVAVGFPPGEPLPDLPTINTHHMLLTNGHQKICELTAANADPSLSLREREVLTWAGRGKSNTDIATILAISGDTVATYMRRIFAKLDCHDRIGAVIKALRLGQIHI
ncbi:helix-turn-helix transcriptional regulator [Erythrobacter oryzae]|uniref:helix-turn-helix transcriptional regulator n=1 Tax=Erythrobacter oryzae TaxID=3019556 RepID=UPI0025541ED6|nr:LuxR family transcriptional regulator [Erythrobacter sp. COR-2]